MHDAKYLIISLFRKERRNKNCLKFVYKPVLFLKPVWKPAKKIGTGLPAIKMRGIWSHFGIFNKTLGYKILKKLRPLIWFFEFR
ncbi:hypothetical protein BpHYR1_046841 [Brachionus plicatilis]|uniref:Uncharacterized protein n=1 Tax=Brachionus plicatilis TaxID=10195 RepID=A0A3M7S0V2_BRAPC|nr:hypothetical protein BpHYR1_046841 [Brachionus plicatilis]